MFKLIYVVSISFAITLSCTCQQNVLAKPINSNSKKLLAQYTEQSSQIGIVGLRLNQVASGDTIVVEVKQNSPAQKKGIMVGDKLISINNKNIAGYSLFSVYNLIKGTAGTNITLSFNSKRSGRYTREITRVSPSSLGLDPVTRMDKSQSSKSPSNDISSRPNFSPNKIKWLDYTSPSKTFSLQIPDAWEVKVDKKSGLIEVFSYDAESVKIYPFFLPGTQISQSQTKSLFTALIKSQTEGHPWSNIEQVGTNGLKATYKNKEYKEIISLVFKVTKIGTAGRLFIARAPVGYSKHYSEIFSKILSSLRFNSTSQTAPGSNTNTNQQLSWKNFQDPKQGSFTLSVPQGWKVEGGTEQPGSLDYRSWVRATSPDQKIVVFMGDASIPTFTIPTFQLASLGFRPGSRYNPGGYSSIIAKYLPSNKFVPGYGLDSLKKIKMQNIKLVSTEEHPNLAKEWNSQYSGLTHYGATSAKFTANNAEGVPVVGTFIGSTRRTSGIWKMTFISGIVCSADEEQKAMQVFVRMFRTFQINPKWRVGQVNNIGRSYQQITNYYTRFNQIQRQSFEARNRQREAWMKQASASLRDTSRSSIRNSAHDEWMRQSTNNIRDTEDVVDPNTGDTYNIWSGSDYNYLHSDGSTILSTSQPIYPDTSWTQLTTLP